MNQLSLFDTEEFYEFPKDLLEYREHFLIMKGDLQKNWEHRIAKSIVPMKEQINLTFRLVLDS